ncbi:MAG: thermonuclease family protein [Patescibacteria group bacterium]
MHRNHTYLLVLVAGLTALIFVYSFLGAHIFPRDFVDNYEDQLAAALTFDTSVPFAFETPIQVVHVVDGDTVQLINGEYVRYVGIDTPESVDPRKSVQCYAKEAAAKNRVLVEGQFVTFYQDVSEKDKYGRWLGYAYKDDGTFVNKMLVEEGYAFAYRYEPDVAKADELYGDESFAKEMKLGLWGSCTVRTVSGREQTNDLR